jgi:hypothetical protein
MHGNVLRRKSRQRKNQRQQQHCTPVDHDETSAVREGTEIRLTELRNFGCLSSVEKFSAAKLMLTSMARQYSRFTETLTSIQR